MELRDLIEALELLQTGLIMNLIIENDNDTIIYNGLFSDFYKNPDNLDDLGVIFWTLKGTQITVGVYEGDNE